MAARSARDSRAVPREAFLSAAAPASSQTSVAGILGWVALGGLVSTLLLVASLVTVAGLPYYLTAREVRPDHPLHLTFGAGSLLGLLLGVVGTSLMVVLLLYSVHKWLPFLHWMGSSRFWMRFHLVCGLLGPLYIVLHAGFKLPTGFISVGFWCMIFVAVSGFFGRYLFGYFPAAALGMKADLAAEQARINELKATLVAQTREAGATEIGKAVTLVRDIRIEPRNFGELVVLDADVRRRADVVRVLLHRANLPANVRRKAERTLLTQLRMQRNIAGFDVARRLLRYWNLLHQPLALAMYLIAIIHILNAILFGGSLRVLLLLED